MVELDLNFIINIKDFARSISKYERIHLLDKELATLLNILKYKGIDTKVKQNFPFISVSNSNNNEGQTLMNLANSIEEIQLINNELNINSQMTCQLIKSNEAQFMAPGFEVTYENNSQFFKRLFGIRQLKVLKKQSEESHLLRDFKQILRDIDSYQLEITNTLNSIGSFQNNHEQLKC